VVVMELCNVRCTAEFYNLESLMIHGNWSQYAHSLPDSGHHHHMVEIDALIGVAWSWSSVPGFDSNARRGGVLHAIGLFSSVIPMPAGAHTKTSSPWLKAILFKLHHVTVCNDSFIPRVYESSASLRPSDLLRRLAEGLLA
jgi:hypothetical protein